MGTSKVGALDTRQIEQIQSGKKQAEALGTSTFPPRFRFVAGFDGTYNDRDNLSSGEYQTNVANTSEQVRLESLSNANLGFGYYAGVGTGGSNGGVFNAAISPTNAIHYAAEKALLDMAVQAKDYLNSNPGATYADISASVIGFSRGCATGVVFAQLLNERGLVTPDGSVIAPPGVVKIQGMVLLDPVHTFVSGEMDISSNVVGDILVVRAANEYRTDFPAAGYDEDPRVTTVTVPGNHSGIGGGYDLHGTGAAVLEAVTSYLKSSGTLIAPVPDELKFHPDEPVALFRWIDAQGQAQTRY